MLDASKYIRNPANGSRITLCNLLYQITLENKVPLFLQLSQRPSGEVDVIIPNTPQAESMAEIMNVQIAAWCHFYWKETNPGAERFFRKLSDRAFSQVLLHEISDCTWDSTLKAVTSPSAQSEMSAIAEFKQQEWVKLLAHNNHPQQTTKKHVNPNVAFPFQDDFLVGSIHKENAKAATPSTKKVIEVKDNEDSISILTTKTTSRVQLEVVVGSRVASGSNPVSGPTANSTSNPKPPAEDQKILLATDRPVEP
jgi:hypothetical protein